MEFLAPMPPNMPKVEAHVSNESSMSDYCRFARLFFLSPLWKALMQILIWGLNKSIVARLMGYECALFCTLIMRYDITL